MGKTIQYILWSLSIIGFFLVSCTDSESEDLELASAPFSKELLNPDSEYIIVIGDVQEYTLGGESIKFYESTMSWIYYQLEHNVPIKCVMMTGDATWGNQEYQWLNYHNYSHLVASKVPFITAIGNHDYTWDSNSQITNRKSTKINDYAFFPILKNSIESYYEKDNIENIILKIHLNNQSYYIISLEFGPRPQVINWISEYINEHPKEIFILLTHEYLGNHGERRGEISSTSQQLSTLEKLTPEELWDTLIRKYDQISFVICGHATAFSEQLYTLNNYNRLVPQLLFNLQYQKNGGDGYIQILEKGKIDNGIIAVHTLNTVTGEYLTSIKTEFSFNLNK